MSATSPVVIALAAFAIADRERQAEMAGREYSLDDSRAVAERFGVEAASIAAAWRSPVPNIATPTYVGPCRRRAPDDVYDGPRRRSQEQDMPPVKIKV